MKNFKKILFVALIAGLSILSYSSYVLLRPLTQTDIILKISKNSKIEDIANLLKEKETKNHFLITSCIKLFNRYRKIYPGHYIIPKGINIILLFKKIFYGRQDQIKITFSAAQNLEDLIEQLSTKLDLSYEELYYYLISNETLGKLGFTQKKLLTLFIPNSYFVYWTTSPEKLIRKIYENYKNFWNEERLAKCVHIGLTPIEVSILASIVQSETNKIEEASVIAGVYLNRLKNKVPICACPTVFFELRKFGRTRLLRKDLKIESGYNTYIKKGLPMGPICLATASYIDAVLNAENHQFMYFCAKEDFSGYHYFSKTLREHINKSRKYKKELDRKKIFL